MERKFKVGDAVKLIGSGNNVKLKVRTDTSNGKYFCIGKDYSVSIYQQNISDLFSEDELTFWIDPARAADRP